MTTPGPWTTYADEDGDALIARDEPAAKPFAVVWTRSGAATADDADLMAHAPALREALRWIATHHASRSLVQVIAATAARGGDWRAVAQKHGKEAAATTIVCPRCAHCTSAHASKRSRCEALAAEIDRLRAASAAGRNVTT